MPSRLHGPEYEVVRPVQLVEYPYSPDFQIETAFSLERFAHVFERWTVIGSWIFRHVPDMRVPAAENEMLVGGPISIYIP